MRLIVVARHSPCGELQEVGVGRILKKQRESIAWRMSTCHRCLERAAAGCPWRGTQRWARRESTHPGRRSGRRPATTGRADPRRGREPTDSSMYGGCGDLQRDHPRSRRLDTLPGGRTPSRRSPLEGPFLTPRRAPESRNPFSALRLNSHWHQHGLIVSCHDRRPDQDRQAVPSWVVSYRQFWKNVPGSQYRPIGGGGGAGGSARR
jgi:hypothetical protein